MNGAIKMSAFESIRRGLEKAKAFPKGQGAGARVHSSITSTVTERANPEAKPAGRFCSGVALPRIRPRCFQPFEKSVRPLQVALRVKWKISVMIGS